MGMKRYELLQDEKARHDVAAEICDIISEMIDSCGDCLFSKRCYPGHNGVYDYLTEEVKE